MPFRRRTIARELSAALAVLAVYALVLLAPWHQANALQQDLATLGFESANWSICADFSAEKSEKNPGDIKCHTTGIGKDDFVALLPPMVAIDLPVVTTNAAKPEQPLAPIPGHAPHSGQPRAPPVAA